MTNLKFAKTLFYPFLFTFFFFQHSDAQTSADQISIAISNQTLPEVLQKLEEKGDVRFFYRDEELPEKAFSLEIKNRSVQEALTEVLSSTNLGFIEYRDQNIILMPREKVKQVYTASYYQALEKSKQIDEDKVDDPEDIVIGDAQSLSPNGRALIKGTVRQKDDEEPIVGATIAFIDLQDGTITDENGDFEFEVPVGTYDILVKYVGFDDLYTKINVFGDGKVDLILRSEAIDLAEVTVRAQSADASVENVQIGVASLDMKNIRKVPAFLGEADVVKNLLLNPGVSSLGEGSTGFNVRGGTVDQNLVQQDEGFFFNSSHALGFFSTFNTDLITAVDLYKGNMPAQYGGRLASALDVEMKNGDFQSFKLKGGVGPVSSRMSVEGPLVKNKVSILAGVRSSYSDWILKQVKVLEVNKSTAFFYDANVRLAIKPSEKSSLILSGYASDDEFGYNDEFGFDYRTLMGQMIYRQILSDKSYNKFSIVASRYESAQTDFAGFDAAQVSNNINYFKVKEHFTTSAGQKTKLDLGLSGILYLVEPGKQTPVGDESDILAKETENDQGLETAIFANLEYEVSRAFLVSAGLRGVYYSFLGKNTVYDYQDPLNPTTESIIGTTEFGQGESIASHTSLEPRLSLRYRFTESASVKLGYSRTAQFINQIFNTDSPTPNSQWQLSTNYLDPNRSHNVSIGYFKNFKSNLWETSFEIYGRSIDNLYDYRDFADLIVNDHIETELLKGIGRSYGAELSIKKKSGAINGWLSYTYSRSQLQVEGINDNDWYSSNFDKPHDASLVLNYQPNRRNTLTINFNYSTGRPTTPPIGNFKIQNGLVVPIYSTRNAYRIPDYHRLDVAYTLGKGYKRDKKIQTSWTISIYNVYARKNAFSVFFTQGAFRKSQANKLAILGSAIPSLTFNLEIL
ncbi:MAG: TonB-dependent receptor plug domain-containing protein [Saprospiraceae bacterium]|nr:TonB-dependent receptor plug domain-containing protein [Saprospiraceae bacterium]